MIQAFVREERRAPTRPVKPKRYNRGALWAERAGVPDPDFTRLSLMRSMERKNRG